MAEEKTTVVMGGELTIRAASFGDPWLLSALVVGGLLTLLIVVILLKFGGIWLQAYMSGADVRLMSLIGMSLRRIKPSLIVTAKVMGGQAGLNTDRAHESRSVDRRRYRGNHHRSRWPGNHFRDWVFRNALDRAGEA